MGGAGKEGLERDREGETERERQRGRDREGEGKEDRGKGEKRGRGRGSLGSLRPALGVRGGPELISHLHLGHVASSLGD